MEKEYIENKIIEKGDFRKKSLEANEYENCKFIQCDFSKSDLSSIKFIDCTFEDCNFSAAALNLTVLNNADFRNCKMEGLRFDTCNDFALSFSFENCILNHSTFFKRRIKKTLFKNCQLNGTDFTGCDLTESVFANCDLDSSTFDRTILVKADFRTSFNYLIDPENNNIKKARFSVHGLKGLLNKYDIFIET